MSQVYDAPKDKIAETAEIAVASLLASADMVSATLGSSRISSLTYLYQVLVGVTIQAGGDASHEFLSIILHEAKTGNADQTRERRRESFEKMREHFDLLVANPKGSS